MSETIYISDFKSECEKLNRCLAFEESESNLKCSTFHVENGCLRIQLEKGCSLNPVTIKDFQLTCVVQDELFKTVYINGNRVFWSSLHSMQQSASPYFL